MRDHVCQITGMSEYFPVATRPFRDFPIQLSAHEYSALTSYGPSIDFDFLYYHLQRQLL